MTTTLDMTYGIIWIPIKSESTNHSTVCQNAHITPCITDALKKLYFPFRYGLKYPRHPDSSPVGPVVTENENDAQKGYVPILQ